MFPAQSAQADFAPLVAATSVARPGPTTRQHGRPAGRPYGPNPLLTPGRACPHHPDGAAAGRLLHRHGLQARQALADRGLRVLGWLDRRRNQVLRRTSLPRTAPLRVAGERLQKMQCRCGGLFGTCEESLCALGVLCGEQFGLAMVPDDVVELTALAGGELVGCGGSGGCHGGSLGYWGRGRWAAESGPKPDAGQDQAEEGEKVGDDRAEGTPRATHRTAYACEAGRRAAWRIGQPCRRAWRRSRRSGLTTRGYPTSSSVGRSAMASV